MSAVFKRSQLKPLVLIAIAASASVYYFTCFTNFGQPETANVSRNFDHGGTTKFVLYWSPFWSSWDYMLGYGFEPFNRCKYKNCFATANRSLIDLEQFDALIFHVNTYSTGNYGVPWTRSPHQIYIFTNLEPPSYICPDLKPYASFFNWTMSYRFDSDIVRRHGKVVKNPTGYTMPSEEVLANKTSLVAWFVSHCPTKSRREALAKELQKFVPVDVYGKCGHLQCSRANESNLSSDGCYEMVERKYKFYLSFENSYCRDYSTEKLSYILMRDLVPVVYGDGGYGLAAPPKSVVNVEDFGSVKELANYLQYLDGNHEEYLKYFEWKKQYRVVYAMKSSACQICERLHEPVKQSIYYDLHEWWWGENKSVCKVGKELPKIVSDLPEDGYDKKIV